MSPLAPRTIALGFAGLGLIGALAGCATTTADAGTSAGGSGTTDSGSGTSGGTDSGGTTGGSYADGTYTEEGSYQSPGGSETISVELTLAGGVVTAVTVTPEGTGTALGFQKKFASGISDEVVGKSLDEIQVSRVSGSSLTSTGFTAALEAIKADAAA